ncbi:MAG: helix-turn-helix domain-containing protein [Spirochaetes bacterium]|nr:helix-turn-helix domain-containing protein [Spirochaetota bacterium]
MIQSLQRALRLARLVSESPDGLRLVDLSQLTGLNKTTIFHLVETLVAEGLLSKGGDARYAIGPLCREWAGAGKRSAVLRRAAALLAEVHRAYPRSNIVYAELGDADLFARFSLSSDRPGGVVYTDDMTLNPYLTVSGVLFAAFMPSERMHGLRLRHPFEYKGREAWGSENAFQACVIDAARRGWAETPRLIGAGQFKVGIPVRDPNGALLATMTFTAEKKELPPAAELRGALLQVARRIGDPAGALPANSPARNKK